MKKLLVMLALCLLSLPALAQNTPTVNCSFTTSQYDLHVSNVNLSYGGGTVISGVIQVICDEGAPFQVEMLGVEAGGVLRTNGISTGSPWSVKISYADFNASSATYPWSTIANGEAASGVGRANQDDPYASYDIGFAFDADLSTYAPPPDVYMFAMTANLVF